MAALAELKASDVDPTLQSPAPLPPPLPPQGCPGIRQGGGVRTESESSIVALCASKTMKI